MRSILAAMVVLATSGYGCTTVAAEYVGENASFIGADLVGRPLVLEDDLVLEFDGLRGLVRDWNDPLSPAWVGGFTTSLGFVERADYAAGLLIALYSPLTPGATLFDLSDPAAPSALSSSFAPYHFTSAILGAGTVYLATTDWLLGYDIATPSAPRLTSVSILTPLDRHRWPTRHGDLLYLLDGAARLRVLDLGQPAAPVDLGAVALPTDRVDAMVIAAGHLYTLQADDSGLELAAYDLAVPLAPSPTARIALPAGSSGVDLLVREGVLYATTDAPRVHAFSLALPGRPAAGFTLAGGPRALAAAPSALLMLVGDEMDVYAPTPFDQPPALLAKRQAIPDLAELATNGGVTVASDREAGDLYVIDVADPRSPAIGTRWTGVAVQKVAIAGNLVAACSPADLRLIDATTAQDAVELARIDYPQADLGVRDCALDGNLLAIALPSYGTLLYDVANPREPRLRFTMRQLRGRVEISGDRLLAITSSNRAAVYDVSDPDLPQLMGTLPLAGVRDIAYSLGRVGLLTSGGLYLYEHEGADDFTRLSRTPVFDAARLVTTGDRAYAIGQRDVHIVNVADPVHPTVDGWFEGAGVVFLLSAANGLIQLDIGRSNYLVRDETWPTASIPRGAALDAPSLIAAPNPFNPAVTIAFSLARPAVASLTVHDARGRLVARLAAGPFSAGRHQVTWRGADETGHPAASGVYLVRLVAGDETPSTTRITLVR